MQQQEIVEPSVECHEANERRKAIQQQVLEQARQQLDDNDERAFVLVAGEGWHPGVVGIVAAKLADEHGCPAAAVALEGETGRGSARSVEGVDLFSVLGRCGDLMLRFGGHAAAAGFTVARAQVASLREALDRAVRDEVPIPPARRLVVDGVVALAEVDESLCEQIDRLAPHGEGNPHPVFAASQVRVENVRPVGVDHVALVISQGGASRPAIGFRMLSRAPRVGDEIDVAFVPEISEYQGGALRLRLSDLKPAGQGIAAADRPSDDER